MASSSDGTAPVTAAAPAARRRAGELDLRVATRVRERRIALGLSLQQTAERLGITYQQVHKYETGVNRLSAGRLGQLAEALEAEVGYFFGEAEPSEPGRTAGPPRAMLELARDLASLRHGRERDAIRAFVRELAGGSAERPIIPESDGAHRPTPDGSSSSTGADAGAPRQVP